MPTSVTMKPSTADDAELRQLVNQMLELLVEPAGEGHLAAFSLPGITPAGRAAGRDAARAMPARLPPGRTGGEPHAAKAGRPPAAPADPTRTRTRGRKTRSESTDPAGSVYGMRDPEVLIRARGLTKSFGDFTAVDGIDFELTRRGEAFGFLGPNGAGKSSTMRMIGCVSPPSGGELSILGLDPVTDGPAIRARLGVVPQEDTLDVELTVQENLLIYGRYFGLPRDVIARAHGPAAGLRAAHRPGRRSGRAAVRRHEAAADDRPVADQRAGDPAPRRADHRARPAGQARGLGPAVPAQAAGRDAGADHALHGRGRAAVRPAGGDGPRQDRRRGLAAAS